MDPSWKGTRTGTSTDGHRVAQRPQRPGSESPRSFRPNCQPGASSPLGWGFLSHIARPPPMDPSMQECSCPLGHALCCPPLASARSCSSQPPAPGHETNSFKHTFPFIPVALRGRDLSRGMGERVTPLENSPPGGVHHTHSPRWQVCRRSQPTLPFTPVTGLEQGGASYQVQGLCTRAEHPVQGCKAGAGAAQQTQRNGCWFTDPSGWSSPVLLAVSSMAFCVHGHQE